MPRQVDTNHDLSVNDLIKALGEMGFSSTCVATSTTEEPLDDGGVNAVWAIASALGDGNGRSTFFFFLCWWRSSAEYIYFAILFCLYIQCLVP